MAPQARGAKRSVVSDRPAATEGLDDIFGVVTKGLTDLDSVRIVALDSAIAALATLLVTSILATLKSATDESKYKKTK